MTTPDSLDRPVLVPTLTACTSQPGIPQRKWIARDRHGLDFSTVVRRLRRPDLNWTIKEILEADENRIVVREEASATPIKAFLGVEPTGRGLHTMSIDLYTIECAKITRSYQWRWLRRS
jgi:predicted ester cyclase